MAAANWGRDWELRAERDRLMMSAIRLALELSPATELREAARLDPQTPLFVNEYGILGVGEKNVAVPFEALNVQRKPNSTAIQKYFGEPGG